VPPVSCTLLYQSTSPHLQQLYTGLLMLHEQGYLRLSQRVRGIPIRYNDDAHHLRDACHAHLDAVLEGSIRLHFDTHDAHEIAVGELDECDFYFKRSYSRRLVNSLAEQQRRKVFPLGLNYRVLPNSADMFALRRGIRLAGEFRAKASACAQALGISDLFGHEPRLSALESPAHLDAEPRVLFFVAAYDPYEDPNRTEEKVADRISINETRARCIKLLRETLGDKFTGGFAPSPYVLKHYAELAAEPGTTSQARYLATLRTYPICVATTGLHGSTGWKLAEYVAFAKAIIAEKLVYRAAGDFEPDRNYLEFESPEECAAAAVRLVEDDGLRHRLMRNNAVYYQRYVRPDALMRNAIETALSRMPSKEPAPLHKPLGRGTAEGSGRITRKTAR
jgi:hypothetical protein